MRKHIVIFILSVIVISVAFMSACTNELLRNRMLDYYADDSNYVELTGVIIEKDDYTNVYVKILSFTDEFYMYNNDVGCFNFYSNKGFSDTISVDDTIVFISAPRIFYDGQRCPILSLNKDGEELLSFMDGKNNYMVWIREEFQ